jgi:hypothetical protein
VLKAESDCWKSDSCVGVHEWEIVLILEPESMICCCDSSSN